MTNQKEGNREFAAPWGSPLRLVSIVGSIVLIGAACFLHATLNFSPAAKLAVTALPVIVLICAAGFMVLGYESREDALLIKRPGWTTRIPLAGLRDVEINPEAMAGAIRIFGNGGLFAFSGLFRSKNLGSFRAYVTDLKRLVVLKLNDRTIVVSPDAPEVFVAELRQRRATPAS